LNIVNEGGKAVNTFLDSMKSQPLSLALVVMNCALLAYLFWSGREALVERNKYVVETQQILASCIHADKLESVVKAFRGDDRR